MNPRPTPPSRVRISRVYTRAGDAGSTRLVGGQLVPKDDPRLEAYGTVDELQVAMGQARDGLATAAAAAGEGGAAALGLLGEHLRYLENRLFTLSGDLATRMEDRWPDMDLPSAADVDYMERLMDALNAPLEPLADFVLPGGHPLVTSLHQCRVICRRAERRIETLARMEPIGEQVRPFINRLADVFFVMARWADHELRRLGLKDEERIWRRDETPPRLPEPARRIDLPGDAP